MPIHRAVWSVENAKEPNWSHAYYCADTEAELLDFTEMKPGDQAWAADTRHFFVANENHEWQLVGGAGVVLRPNPR